MNCSVAVFACSTLVILFTFCALGCNGQHGATEFPDSVSLQDIDKLGPDSTLDDVSQLLKHTPLMEFPWFEYPAKEGGIFVFSFIATNEMRPESQASSQSVPLVAVIKSPSHEGFMRGEGIYVYPKNMVGTRFTGFPLPTTKGGE